MKTSGFNASTLGYRRGNSLYRKLSIVSLIIALMLASLPVASAFAAPATQAGGGSNLEESWGNKLRQLQAEVTFFNNFQTKPGQNRNAQVGQYLDKYRTTLAAAQGLVVSGSGFDSNGRVTNEGQARRSNQLLGQYLSAIRGLKDKIGNASGDENNSNTGNNGGNAGIPVTGGATNTNQNAGQNNNQNNSPAKLWGPQFRELQAAQTWFNNFHTKPGQGRNSEEISRYLDQYASALRAAYSIIVNGGANTTAQNANGSNGQGASLNRGTPQQQLAMYLSMMRGLREKIAEGGLDNNRNNNGNTNTGGQ
jgi:hypothetical protein